MPAKASSRTYGKSARRAPAKGNRLFAELSQSPLRKNTATLNKKEENLEELARNLASVKIIEDEPTIRRSPRKSIPPVRFHEVLDEYELQAEKKTAKHQPRKKVVEEKAILDETPKTEPEPEPQDEPTKELDVPQESLQPDSATVTDTESKEESLLPANEDPELVLSWEEVCPSGDQITKIAEASYAEVYRVTNDRGTSIIKVMRLPSPIKPQTKQQINAKLVDEEPHTQQDIEGELQISEWLADVPGFVVYKDRYLVRGKATKQLLETHQAYQRKMKRKDPGRAQFYPSPSRYLDETEFMVVELGDAGKALEDWKLTTASQMWDIFFLEALALARAEDMVMFEHRDLHEGNLCLRQVTEPTERPGGATGAYFGYSGLEITILDYGLSRAEDLSVEFAEPVAYDLERDLSLFTSTHAPQCQVYRRMRSFLMRADRECFPPEAHRTPYPSGVNGRISWSAWVPFTNVLWLAYLYEYLIGHFKGGKKELEEFRDQTKEMWKYLNPDAGADVPCFGCAGDVVCFGVEAGWLREDQLVDHGVSVLEGDEGSILVCREVDLEAKMEDQSPSRRSSRRTRTR